MNFKIQSMITCSICGKKENNSMGHNGAPVVEGRVCNLCNSTVIIPARSYRTMANTYITSNDQVDYNTPDKKKKTYNEEFSKLKGIKKINCIISRRTHLVEKISRIQEQIDIYDKMIVEELDKAPNS